MTKQIGIRKIPGLPKYKISKEGEVQTLKGRILKEKVDLKGAFVRLKGGESTSFVISSVYDSGETIRTYYIRNLLQKTFKEPEDLPAIISFLEIKKAEGVRVLWKLEKDRVRCMVNYQGIGTLQRVPFDLFSLRDAKIIFKKFAPKWKPYRKYKNGV